MLDSPAWPSAIRYTPPEICAPGCRRRVLAARRVVTGRRGHEMLATEVAVAYGRCLAEGALSQGQEQLLARPAQAAGPWTGRGQLSCYTARRDRGASPHPEAGLGACQ